MRQPHGFTNSNIYTNHISELTKYQWLLKYWWYVLHLPQANTYNIQLFTYMESCIQVKQYEF